MPNLTDIVRAELAVFDRAGKRERVLGSPDEYRQIELSPDGRRLAVQVRGQIGVVDVERGVFTPVTGQGLIRTLESLRLTSTSIRCGNLMVASWRQPLAWATGSPISCSLT